MKKNVVVFQNDDGWLSSEGSPSTKVDDEGHALLAPDLIGEVYPPEDDASAASPSSA